jgi:hypothetical protein
MKDLSFALRTATRAAVCGVALFFAALQHSEASPLNVQKITVGKSQSYFQYGPFDFVEQPFFYEAFAEVYASYPGSIFSGRFMPPGRGQIDLLNDGFGNLFFQTSFLDAADWNAAFPSGTYWFDLTTASAPQEYTAWLNLAERYPERPRILNDWYSGVIQLNYTQPYTYRWSDFKGFQTNPSQPSAIQFEIIDFFDQVVYRQRIEHAATSLTVQGQSIPPGFYIGRVLFGHSDAGQDQFFTEFQSISATGTAFLISAIDGPPRLPQQVNLTVTVGQLFAYVIEATNAPGSFSATALPPGLEMSSDFGWICGFPTQPGTTRIPITATNSLGTGSGILNLTVLPDTQLSIKSSTKAAGAKGAPFLFQVLVSGGSSAARLSARGLPAGITLNDATGEISGTPTEAGTFAVTLTVTDGNTTASAPLELTFKDDPAFPSIRGGGSVTITPGQSFTYKIEAPSSGNTPSDETAFTIVGDLPVGLSFDRKTGVISGTFGGQAARDGIGGPGQPLSGGTVVGTIQLFANNSRGTATIPLVFLTPPTGVVNISTRMAVGAGDNVMIGGFIVTGNAPKKLILRGIGPSLRAGEAPLPGSLQDPVLQLFSRVDDVQELVATNDNWKSHQQQEIVDTTVAPTDDRESAIVAAFEPGNYTAVVRGKDGSTGIGLVEIYDLGTASLSTTSSAKLAQISTRGRVETGNDVMIGGFIISGATTKVIVRAVGPSLGSKGVPGALDDTTLELRGGNGDLLATNDDWRTDQEKEIIDTTVPPTDNRESAVVRTLTPGAYTAIVRGKNDLTGVALVEVYVLQ